MNIDAHQHFWQYNSQEYGWIGGRMMLKRDFLPADLRPLQQAIGITGAVAVQARQTIEETRWLLELADAYPFIKGVVGWVELRSPHLRAQLDRFIDHPKFCGVRHIVHDEIDDRFMLRPDVLHGIAMLNEFGLTYDLLLFPKHLPVACELVNRFPEQPFVLDHIAKPRIKDGLLEPWATDIVKLAQFPNVCCKVSGMVTEADWQAWTPDDFTPFLDTVFEAFGANRLMIGSDWPVCTVAGKYSAVMQVVFDYVEKCSSSEQQAVLGGTAAQFYGLE
ncbi:MAG: amidohydrolase family protein [Anaerolineae bacterium]|nr:amidohydrolase family protein [Anaerolineae bacterium]